MARRGLTMTMIALIAVQLIGSMGFASVCLEPCSDEEPETSCTPVCSLCTTCTHAQQAIVPPVPNAGPDRVAVHGFQPQPGGRALPRADEILHVPLAG